MKQKQTKGRLAHGDREERPTAARRPAFYMLQERTLLQTRTLDLIQAQRRVKTYETVKLYATLLNVLPGTTQK